MSRLHELVHECLLWIILWRVKQPETDDGTSFLTSLSFLDVLLFLNNVGINSSISECQNDKCLHFKILSSILILNKSWWVYEVSITQTWAICCNGFWVWRFFFYQTLLSYFLYCPSWTEDYARQGASLPLIWLSFIIYRFSIFKHQVNQKNLY